jgi:hypothetical protein
MRKNKKVEMRGHVEGAKPRIFQKTKDHDPILWRGADLSVNGAPMYYRGRLSIDPIRGSVNLVDLDGAPALDEVLHSDDYEVEIRIIRRVPKESAR